MVGKHVASKVTGNTPLAKKSDPPNDDEKHLIGGIKTGRNIALVGVFCPIFWLSLFTGASGSVLLFDAIHSSIVIFIGGAYSFINFIMLRRLRLKLKVKQYDAMGDT